LKAVSISSIDVACVIEEGKALRAKGQLTPEFGGVPVAAVRTIDRRAKRIENDKSNGNFFTQEQVTFSPAKPFCSSANGKTPRHASRGSRRQNGSVAGAGRLRLIQERC
jgi:hypothetical protein